MNTNISHHRTVSYSLCQRILALLLIALVLTTADPAYASCASKKATAFRTKAKVKKLRKNKVTTHSVQLKWNKFKGASKYQVYRAVSKKGPFRKIKTTRKNKVTDKSVTHHRTYFYKVRAMQKRKGKKAYSRFSAVLKVRTKKSTSHYPILTKGRYPQNLPSQESTKQINNPDQGFYRPIYVRVGEDGVSYNKNIVNDTTQLYHLRIDISAFSQANNGTADKLLSENALAGIEELLSFLYEKNKSAIARFVYDPGLNGASNKEPSLTMILQHITQLSAILDRYRDTLTAIEVGLIGPWGEMHTSTLANKESINALIDSYLNHTTEIPILVRTPQMIYNYLGITLEDTNSYRIDPTAKAYRLGLFNDGYLGSSSDLGTYTNREKEVPWLALQCGHLPYGGEVVAPDSTLHDIENCLGEMNQLHLSYLNTEWNNTVIDKWKNSTYTAAAGSDSLYYGETAFRYIENHLGYRFVVEQAILEYDSAVTNLGIELSLKNVGFGNLNRAMNMSILLQAENGEITTLGAGSFTGQETIKIQKYPYPAEGNYKVYLKLDKGDGKYALRFDGELWNEDLQANFIGSFHKSNTAVEAIIK